MEEYFKISVQLGRPYYYGEQTDVKVILVTASKYM
jgi:hypothetical protein